VTDLLQMIGRAGRPQFDTKGIACIFLLEKKLSFYSKFLHDPFPVESTLDKQIIDHINAEIASGTLASRESCIDYISWTYFFRRLTKNPTYYGLNEKTAKGLNLFLGKLVDSTFKELVSAGCIEFDHEDASVKPTKLGLNHFSQIIILFRTYSFILLYFL